MMPCLPFYITDHVRPVRLAHAECAISPLPAEGAPLRPFLLHPTGRVRLNYSEAIRNGEIGGQPRQQVNVICGATNGYRRRMEFTQNSAEITVQVGPNGVDNQ